LRRDHDLSEFDCGEPSLDHWLRRRALQNAESGASKTYVVCAGRKRVVAYYALAAGGVAHAGAPSRVRRNMPDPVPVMVLGRLAVDRSFQGRGLGSALLRDAILRTLHVAEMAGVRAILAHAISDRARKFYEASGFIPSPLDPMTLMITTAAAAKAIGEESR
jgi:GNAT superfamily N-acetyltransferase